MFSLSLIPIYPGSMPPGGHSTGHSPTGQKTTERQRQPPTDNQPTNQTSQPTTTSHLLLHLWQQHPLATLDIGGHNTSTGTPRSSVPTGHRSSRSIPRHLDRLVDERHWYLGLLSDRHGTRRRASGAVLGRRSGARGSLVLKGLLGCLENELLRSISTG